MTKGGIADICSKNVPLCHIPGSLNFSYWHIGTARNWFFQLQCNGTQREQKPLCGLVCYPRWPSQVTQLNASAQMNLSIAGCDQVTQKPIIKNQYLRPSPNRNSLNKGRRGSLFLLTWILITTMEACKPDHLFPTKTSKSKLISCTLIEWFNLSLC